MEFYVIICNQLWPSNFLRYMYIIHFLIYFKINRYYLHNPPFYSTAHEKKNSNVNIKIKHVIIRIKILMQLWIIKPKNTNVFYINNN